MNSIRTVALILALPSMLTLANVSIARPQEAGMLHELAAPAKRCETPTQAVLLPALYIEVCETCKLGREEVSAMKQGYAAAAYAAGYQIDILAATRVRIVETGMLENGTPYARGETAGMWFRVGNPDPGETLGSVAGRMTFVILSGAR